MTNTAIEALDLRWRRDNELRLSKSGCSVKCGDRIIAKCPVWPAPGLIDSKKFDQWLADADKLIEGWNAVVNCEHDLEKYEEAAATTATKGEEG